MKQTVKLLAALGLAASFSFSGFANAADSEAKLNPWVDCGIGAMIFPGTPAGAVISNVIWDMGTTAVTSAGASKNTCESKRSKVAMLVGATYANLEEETVKGEGAHISAMLNLANCQASAHDGIIRSVRADFSQSLQNSAYMQKSMQDKAQAYYQMVDAKLTGEFSAQCQAL